METKEGITPFEIGTKLTPERVFQIKNSLPRETSNDDYVKALRSVLGSAPETKLREETNLSPKEAQQRALLEAKREREQWNQSHQIVPFGFRRK